MYADNDLVWGGQHMKASHGNTDLSAGSKKLRMLGMHLRKIRTKNKKRTPSNSVQNTEVY